MFLISLLSPFAFLILVAVVLVAIVLAEVEQFGWATFSLLVCVGIAQMLNVVDVVDFVKLHTLASLGYAGLYLVVGIVWSFIKWFSFLHNYRDTFREAKEKFCTENGLDKTKELTGEMLIKFHNPNLIVQMRSDFYNYLVSNNGSRGRNNSDPFPSTTPLFDTTKPLPAEFVDQFVTFASTYRKSNGYGSETATFSKPLATKNKARIVSWMGLWPCSVIGTLLNDPVRRMFGFMFTSFKAQYQRMSDHVFANDTELK